MSATEESGPLGAFVVFTSGHSRHPPILILSNIVQDICAVPEPALELLTLIYLGSFLVDGYTYNKRLSTQHLRDLERAITTKSPQWLTSHNTNVTPYRSRAFPRGVQEGG